RTESIARNVSKDNTIRYRSNRYTVPIGTYSSVKKKVVFLEVTEQERLLIRESPEGEVIADHRVSKESGKLIQSRDHLRDRSKGTEELKQQALAYFEDREAASDYLDELSRRYPRYRRDQFNIIRDVATMYPNHLTTAQEKCSQEGLFSANDFRDVIHYLAILTDDGHDPKPDTERPKKSGIQVATRPLQAYTDILKGVTAK
ncbi:MAG: IS21 family transposase, partial [Exiguobacterium sp.]|nr:IS21 family transposase [Exiguobacterium sp.]